MLRHFLLGTAGHVDHGKTSLIKTLTGTDTDRLPEEKRRGLTVDLGFAALECEGMLLGIVDVPGHERFIKNMLAGATGIDLALLVVAADEGVMPQTREHFGVLKYLGIDAGVIAITKCDLVDEEMAELVKEDVGELAAGSFLAGAPVVEVSAKTGEGLEHLRSQLAIEADKLPAPDLGGPFRLSVDRCFSLPGMGTIVTGSVANGQVSCGETLQVLPEGKLVTVRNIESHGASLPSVGRGQRAALNLTGVHYTEIERGYMLATVGSLMASRRLTVQFELRQSYDRPLKPRNRIRFYSGTSETIDEEFQEISDTIAEEEETEKRFVDLLDPIYRKRLTVAILLAVFAQFSGINVVFYYGTTLLEQVGFKSDSALSGTAFIGFFNLIFTLVAIWLVDKLGRRALLQVGTLGAIACLIGIGVMIDGSSESKSLIALMCGFVAFFAFSLGPIKFIFASEIFPTNIRSHAVSVVILSMWAADTVVGQFFPYLRDNLGPAKTFFLFAAFLVPQLFVVWKLMPETARRSLEEIEREYAA